MPTNLDAASVLVVLVGTFSMEMLLPAGIPTLETFRTGSLLRPDNVFCSAPLVLVFVECQTRPELRPAHMDHFPITGTLDLTPECSAPPAWQNWKSVQWDEFQTSLSDNLGAIGQVRPIQDKNNFFAVFNLLTAAIQSTTDQHIPEMKTTPYTKRWWSPELTQM